ncbi:hypothetical protein Tco_0610032 [Tanacetum coccineum]
MSSLQHNQNADNNQKDYKGKYKALKAELALLTKKIDNKSEESVSSEDEGVTRVKAFINIAEDEPVVGKTDARSGQWVEITMKKVQRLLSMNDGDEKKRVLDYTNVDLYYMEDQRKNLLSKFNTLKKELSSFSDLKKVIEKWTSSNVTLDHLLTEQVPGDIICALGGRGRRKETISSKKLCSLRVRTLPLRLYLISPLTPSLLMIIRPPVSDNTKQVTIKESSVKHVIKKDSDQYTLCP